MATLVWVDANGNWKYWVLILLAFLQIVAAVAAAGAEKFRSLSDGHDVVRALSGFLDWMHGQVFSSDKNTRITVMVPDRSKRNLHVFLRSRGFPSRSLTRLACDCNTNDVHGAAGHCFCRNQPRPTVVDVEVDPESPHLEKQLAEYARASAIPVHVARNLARRAQYYFAVPLGGQYGHPIGVLVVDCLEPQILAGATDTDCQAAEDRVKFLATWVAERLAMVPESVRQKLA